MSLSKRIITIIRKSCWIAIMVYSATLCSCSKDNDDDKPVSKGRTVLVYMVAENSLGHEMVGSDIQEMLVGLNRLGKDDRLILYVDDTQLPHYYYLDCTNKTFSYRNLSPDYRYKKEMDSASPETLDAVIQFVRKQFPASSYGLVMWSHGNGWVGNRQDGVENVKRRAFGIDNGHNTTMNIGNQMKIEGMANVLKKYADFEYILFDACFMQTIEVAYELRNCAKYIIGSPAEIPEEGAPYNNIMCDLFARPFNPEALVGSYFDYYANSKDYGVLLSAIKTSELDGFAERMKQYLSRYQFASQDYSSCQNYFKYDEWNFDGVLQRLPDYYDIKAIMMQNLSDADMQEWQMALNKVVVASYATDSWYSDYEGDDVSVDKSQYSGLSMYLPLNKYKSEQFYNDYYNTQWAKLFNIK